MAVSKVIGYGLVGQGLIPNRAGIFLFATTSKPALRPTQIPPQLVLGTVSSGKDFLFGIHSLCFHENGL